MAQITSQPQSSSRIRDHLANERTYLAWMRTAISLMGFGVVIARLRSILNANSTGTGQGWLLGLLFTLIGLLTIVLCTQHFFAVRSAIDQATYEPKARWVIVLSTTLLCLGVGVLYVLLALPRLVNS